MEIRSGIVDYDYIIQLRRTSAMETERKSLKIIEFVCNFHNLFYWKMRTLLDSKSHEKSFKEGDKHLS